jgi:hypothetical protein
VILAKIAGMTHEITGDELGRLITRFFEEKEAKFGGKKW